MSCPICYDVIDSERNNCITSCGHSFCFDCIVRTVETSDACPLCRELFIAQEPEEEEEEDDEEEDEDDSSYSDTFVFNEDLYEDDRFAKVKTLSDRLSEKGIGAMELLSILIDRYERKNAPEFIECLNHTFYRIVDEADDEAEKEAEERDAFALEDKIL